MQTLANFDAAMKELYTPGKVDQLIYKDRPLLGMIKKMEKFYGDVMPIPVYYGNPMGRSAKFAQAQKRGALEYSKTVKFLLTRVQDYGYVTIDNETMEASANDQGAFLKAKETEIDGIYNSMSDSLAQSIVGSGWGDIGTVGSFATNTITLSITNDVVNFEVGMEVVVAAAVSTGNIRAVGSSGNGLIITNVNRSTGVLTFGFNVNDGTNGIPTIANGDTIFNRGDRDESASPTMLRAVGIQSWVPDADPTATLFLGVDRTKDVTRLGGLRKSVTGLPIEEALIDGAHYANRESAPIDHYVMSPQRFADLVKALGSKVQFVDVMATAEVGYRGVKIIGPARDIICVGDKTIKDTRTYGLTIPSWELCSLGKAPKPIGGDGLEMLRLSNQDGVECRIGYYANLKCTAPGKNIVLTH